MPTHDIDARRIAWVGGALALVVVFVVAAVFLLLKGWHVPARIEHARPPTALPFAGPTLQSAPQQDLARYRTEKQRVLESGAWLDVQRSSARIPIAAAMDLLARSPQTAASASGGAR